MARRSARVLITLFLLALAFVGGWAAFSAAEWVAFGKNIELPEERDALVAQFMPTSDVDESHDVFVDAPAAVSWAAVQRVDVRDSRLVRMLFRGRELIMGSSPRAASPQRPLIQELGALGWGTLSLSPGRQLILGAAAQPWLPDVSVRRLSPDGFAEFRTPDYVKIIVLFAVDSLGPGRSRVRTETLAIATDDAARQKFRRYWAVYSPGILLIRRAALSLVKEQAERSAAP